MDVKLEMQKVTRRILTDYKAHLDVAWPNPCAAKTDAFAQFTAGVAALAAELYNEGWMPR